VGGDQEVHESQAHRLAQRFEVRRGLSQLH
jgi:hypothetical protein